MSKLQFKVLLIFLMLIIVFTEHVISQDIKDEKLSEENPMRKGSWAIVFELGTLFGKPSSIEEYNFLLKYHIEDNTAIRINVGFSGYKQNDRFYDFYNYSKYGLQGNVTLQYFITNKYFARPFVSIGPYFLQNYEKGKYYLGNEYKSNNWDLGILLTIGAEAVVYKNIGIIGEYIFRGYYGKKSSFFGDNNFAQEKSIGTYKFRANTCRLGVSLYF